MTKQSKFSPAAPVGTADRIFGFLFTKIGNFRIDIYLPQNFFVPPKSYSRYGPG
jgi:hypothetical protein